jgi:hypothetical protein
VRFFVAWSCVATLLVAACAPDPLEVTVYGEEFAEEGIDADDFSDGWSVTFSRFDVRLSELALLDASGEAVAADETVHVVDLSEPSGGDGHPVATLHPRASYARLRYALAPRGGPALLVAGAATKGGMEKSFSWAFETTQRYLCEPAAAADASVTTAEITVHADHLFFDDLDSPEPLMAFDLIAAADVNGDGEVTQAELEATDITAEARYQVGGRDITDLWGFLEAQSRNVGHIDGEGHCDTEHR